MHTTLPSTGDTTHKALHARPCRCHHVRDHACAASLRRHRRCTPRWFPKTCSLVACSWGHHTPKVSALAIGYRAHVAATASYSDAFAWNDRPLHSSYLVPTPTRRHHTIRRQHIMVCQSSSGYQPPHTHTRTNTHRPIHQGGSSRCWHRTPPYTAPPTTNTTSECESPPPQPLQRWRHEQVQWRRNTRFQSQRAGCGKW